MLIIMLHISHTLFCMCRTEVKATIIFFGRNQLELNFDIKKFFEVLTNNTQVIDCSFNLFPILAQMVYKIRSDLKWIYISHACRC